MFYFVVDNYTDEQQIKPLEVCASILSNSDIYTSAYINDETEFEKQLSSIIKVENVYTDPIANNGKMELNVGIVNIKEFEKLVGKFSDNQTFTFGNNEISLKNKRYEINKMFEKYSTYNLTGNLHNLFFESFDYKISKQDVKPIDNKFYTVDIEVDVTANDRYDEASKILIKYLKLIALGDKAEQVGDVYPLSIYNDQNGIVNTLSGFNATNSIKSQIQSLQYNFIFRNIESLNLMEVLFKNQTFYVKNFELTNEVSLPLTREGKTHEFFEKQKATSEGFHQLWDKSALWNSDETNWKKLIYMAKKAGFQNEIDAYLFASSETYGNDKHYYYFILPNKIDAITKVYLLDTISDLELNQMKDYVAKRVSSQNFKFKNGGIQFTHENTEIVVSMLDVVDNIPQIQNYNDWQLPSVYALNVLHDSLYKHHFLPLTGHYQTNENRFIEFDENSCCYKTYFEMPRNDYQYKKSKVWYSNRDKYPIRPVRIKNIIEPKFKLEEVYRAQYVGTEGRPDEPYIDFILDYDSYRIEILDNGDSKSLYAKINGKEHIFTLVQQEDENSLSFVSKDKTMQLYFENIVFFNRNNNDNIYMLLRGDFTLYHLHEYADEPVISGTFHGSIKRN